MFFLRLISWIILVGLFCCVIFVKEIGTHILLLLFAAGAFIATYEVCGMFEKKGYRAFKKLSAFFGALSVITVFFLPGEYHLLPTAVFVMICWGKLLFNNGKTELLQKIPVSLGAYLMGFLPIFFLSKIYFYNTAGAGLLLYMVAVTKSGDTFAYVTGMLSNRILKGKNHKIVPSISPKKSWEGTIGGLICSVLISFFLYNYLFKESALLAVVMGIMLFLGGFAGDLSESALKRICGVKDSGAIIPGMGGVYDLLDSFIFNAPLFYFTIYLFYK